MNSTSHTPFSLIRRLARSGLRALTAAVLVTSVAACDEAVDLDALVPGDTILAFGDSLTFGKGVTRDKAYPAVLQTLSGYTVINAGISGETTTEGRQRLPSALAEYTPTLVILFEGGNDVLRNTPAERVKSNLDAMIKEIQSSGAAVALVAVPERSLFSSAAPWYGELAEAHGLPLEDRIVSKLLKTPSMKSDAVHFNEAGYRALAEAVHALLTEHSLY